MTEESKDLPMFDVRRNARRARQHAEDEERDRDGDKEMSVERPFVFASTSTDTFAVGQAPSRRRAKGPRVVILPAPERVEPSSDAQAERKDADVQPAPAPAPATPTLVRVYSGPVHCTVPVVVKLDDDKPCAVARLKRAYIEQHEPGLVPESIVCVQGVRTSAFTPVPTEAAVSPVGPVGPLTDTHILQETDEWKEASRLSMSFTRSPLGITLPAFLLRIVRSEKDVCAYLDEVKGRHTGLLVLVDNLLRLSLETEFRHHNVPMARCALTETHDFLKQRVHSDFQTLVRHMDLPKDSQHPLVHRAMEHKLHLILHLGMTDKRPSSVLLVPDACQGLLREVETRAREQALLTKTERKAQEEAQLQARAEAKAAAARRRLERKQLEDSKKAADAMDVGETKSDSATGSGSASGSASAGLDGLMGALQVKEEDVIAADILKKNETMIKTLVQEMKEEARKESLWSALKLEEGDDDN